LLEDHSMKIPDFSPHINPSSTLLDSEILYKGHGKIESASESSSVMHVISHELEHVAEFKAQANRDEVQIRSIDMQIHFEFRDGRLVAVGGETKMTSAEKTSSKEEIGKQLDLFPNSKILPNETIPVSQDLQVEETLLKEKLELIQNELRTLLNKSVFKDLSNKGKENESIQVSYREIRNRLQQELEDLKRRVEAEKSRELLLKVADIQNNLRTGFIDPAEINILISPEKHLDLLA
jgi:hypothetical protein